MYYRFVRVELHIPSRLTWSPETRLVSSLTYGLT